VTLFNLSLNSRHALSPTKGLVGFTFFWTMTAFTAACALGALIVLVAPHVGL
jgi:hypothetical protein